MHQLLSSLTFCTALALLVACKADRPDPRPMQPAAFAIDEQAARSATALAAVFEAAAQVADPDALQVFRNYGIAPAVAPAIDELFPERRALAAAVAQWPEPRKRAALAWVLENATWTSMLNALALESFDADFEPLESGSSMSQFNPTIFGNRASLAPLLRNALEDEAIARIATTIAVQREPFTPAGIRERREKLVAYLRMGDDLPKFSAFYNSLLAPTNGVNAYRPDGTIMMVVGPSANSDDRSMVLFHEMAHQPVNRVMARPRLAAALESSSCAFAKVEETYGYTEWIWFFSEALVRSLSYRLEGIAPLDTGFIFEGSLTSALERWEADPQTTFEDAVVSMLDGIRTQHCGDEAGIEPFAPTCPAPSMPLSSGTCLVLPTSASPDTPVAVYLHGMTTSPRVAFGGGLQLARAAGEEIAILMPLGARGECAWSSEFSNHLCWPTKPDGQQAVVELAARLRADLEEMQHRLGRQEPIAPFLVGFSNGGFAAERIAATTDMDLAGLVVLHAGGSAFPLEPTKPIRTLLRAARGDQWHFPLMIALREKLTAASWPFDWQERDGEHAQIDGDCEAVVRFIQAARPARPAEANREAH